MGRMPLKRPTTSQPAWLLFDATKRFIKRHFSCRWQAHLKLYPNSHLNSLFIYILYFYLFIFLKNILLYHTGRVWPSIVIVNEKSIFLLFRFFEICQKWLKLFWLEKLSKTMAFRSTKIPNKWAPKKLYFSRYLLFGQNVY